MPDAFAWRNAQNPCLPCTTIPFFNCPCSVVMIFAFDAVILTPRVKLDAFCNPVATIGGIVETFSAHPRLRWGSRSHYLIRSMRCCGECANWSSRCRISRHTDGNGAWSN